MLSRWLAAILLKNDDSAGLVPVRQTYTVVVCVRTDPALRGSSLVGQFVGGVFLAFLNPGANASALAIRGGVTPSRSGGNLSVFS